ncbi:uncharacterized protein LOC143285455 [Babylonia areolata]|uniref:uncharacterized protein LOC143285455 n=1 Tax=Babylonia areolata TaxID=304850 RepID=UPI003FD67C88
MMPHIIPGGRQRASSDGDVLEDEEDTINASGVLDRLTEAHRNVSRSVILTTDDDRDSDDVRSISDSDRTNKSKKKGLRSKISFKTVKKAVSRAFPRKDSLFGSSSSLNKEDMPTSVKTSSAAGVWTPTLKRRAKDDEHDRPDYSRNHRSNREEGDTAGTDSLSRPLITDPGMMIAKWDRTPGNVGLFNHGNTCFMNAVLQCLSHTDSFTEYFITDMYKDDLKNSRNSSKKLGSKGSKGDVTEQLGLLLKCLWTEKYNSEISIDFKAIVGKYNNQYKGSSQHDSQEFLLWLLDRIHEDLVLPLPPQNKKKKQTKSLIGPSRSQTDEELAEAAKGGLTSSFVSQLFQGLHRSSLSCPHCGRHSNTFDPYLCVSLPLPQKCLRPVYVIVVTLREPTQAVKIGLSLSMYDTIRELREAVSADTGIHTNLIVLCELTKDGFYATYSNEQPLSDIPETCVVYAIEMHPDDQRATRESATYETPTVQILLLHVEKKSHSSQRFCLPEVLQISREADLKTLEREILYQLGDAVKQEVFSQRLRSLFQLQIVDGSSRKTYLPLDVEMPLYTQTVDRVLSMFGDEFGPQHLKLIVEWEREIKEAVIEDDQEHIMEHSSVNRVRSLAQHPVTVSLEECFELYTQEEKLAGEDAWLCPHCKKPQKGATKTLGLWSLPDVLVLHLKRFKQTGLRRNKLDTVVEFPVENLNMSSHVVLHSDSSVLSSDDMRYDLIGVTNHYGNMMGGHYKAFCKNAIDGTWQEFDDRRVTPIADTQVVSKSAYILFYQRRSLSKLVNQNLHTAAHWVFTLQRQLTDKSSPQRRKGSNGSPVKKGGIQQDLEYVASTSFDRQVFSKEWNGQSSPTRRPPNRPLTPQPQRRQSWLEVVGEYDQSPTVIKPRPSFRTSRPSLSRQLSDAAVRGKKQQHQETGPAEQKTENTERRSEPRYSATSSATQIQPQILQVQLPPKTSPDHDLIGSDIPKTQNSEILQPQQVHLPAQSPRDSRQPAAQHRTSSAFKGVEQSHDISQSSKGASSPGHIQTQTSPVDVHVINSSTYHQHQNQVRPPSLQRDSSRPWQFESQSSRSSHETQSSFDSQRSQPSHDSSRPPYLTRTSDGSEFYDWRQPEAKVDRQLENRSSGFVSGATRPATAVTSRVKSKPPLPPKILTRSIESNRLDNGSASSPTHRQDEFHVTVTAPSLTSPPSPAPKDSVGDIQHQLTEHEHRHGHQEPRHTDRTSAGERFIALNEGQHSPVEDLAEDGCMLREGEFENRRRKIASKIEGEQIVRRRRTQNVPDHKFATIARGNRDARSEPREIIAPPMVPRSSTDHSIHFSSYSQASPSHMAHPSSRYSTGYSPLSDRGSVSSSSSGHYPRPELKPSAGGKDSPSLPLYARDERDTQYSLTRENRHQIYRGPMFQRPKKSGDISAPSLRESSV